MLRGGTKIPSTRFKGEKSVSIRNNGGQRKKNLGNTKGGELTEQGEIWPPRAIKAKPK